MHLHQDFWIQFNKMFQFLHPFAIRVYVSKFQVRRLRWCGAYDHFVNFFRQFLVMRRLRRCGLSAGNYGIFNVFKHYTNVFKHRKIAYMHFKKLSIVFFCKYKIQKTRITQDSNLGTRWRDRRNERWTWILPYILLTVVLTLSQDKWKIWHS